MSDLKRLTNRHGPPLPAVADVMAEGLNEIRQAAATPGARERMVITTIGDVTPKRVEWTEKDLVARGMLTGLVAPGGTVKGLYGIHLAAKLAQRGGKTLFVCSEDALDYIIRPRFTAAGCDGSLAYSLSIVGPTGERVPRFPTDLPLLAAAITAIQPELVVVDPIASYIDPGLDMGQNNEMRLILQPLIALARDAYVAILVIYHLGKMRERGAIGTVAFEDACRLILTAARDDDEDVRHVELTKSNIGPTGYGRRLRIVGVPLEIDGETVDVAKLVDEGRSGKSVHALLSKRGAPGPEPEKRELARKLLVEALVAGGTRGSTRTRPSEWSPRGPTYRSRRSGGRSPSCGTTSSPSVIPCGTTWARLPSGVGSRSSRFWWVETMPRPGSSLYTVHLGIWLKQTRFQDLRPPARARARRARARGCDPVESGWLGSTTPRGGRTPC